MSAPDRPILPYERRPATVEPWDPAAPVVAARVASMIRSARPDLHVEHVGSSAVPGLSGKRIVDLGVVAAPDDIPGLAESLVRLGFQRQPGPAAFPPTRPLLLGSIEHEGRIARLHLHVMPPARRELAELVGFRDLLRRDADLRAVYEAVKRSTAARVGGEAKRYAFTKGEWVEQILIERGIRAAPRDGGATIEPGGTIGVLGGGQLGRMLGYAARALGYGVRVLDPDASCPASVVADEVVVAPYDDAGAAARLAAECDVVTYELEHIHASLVDAVFSEGVLVRPGAMALRVTQDRIAERRFLRDVGELSAPWRTASDPSSVREAGEALGFPVRVKTPTGGYDGRSQVRIEGPDEVEAALASLGRGAGDPRPLLVERELAFERELSVVAARDARGRVRTFPAGANRHDEGILVESIAPAPVDPLIAADAAATAGAIIRALDVVGTLTVELFQMPDGQLVVNELAPRVHNSGHWTVEGCRTSQFEQHVRAICGLPLGSTELHTPVALVNLLGTGERRPAQLAGTAEALADPTVHLHLYDKAEVFERRKMGHLVATGEDADIALDRARQARARLHWD